MSLLAAAPQTDISVAGARVPIQTDYRASVAFELMMCDPEIPDSDRALRMLEIYLPQFDWRADAPANDVQRVLLDHVGDVIAQLLRFYLGGNPVPAAGKPAPRVYDFGADGGYIVASFLQAYQIHLTAQSLHWWEFRALFENLPEDTAVKKAIKYRTMKIDPKLPAAERKRYAALKRAYALKAIQDGKEQARRSRLEAALLAGDARGLEEAMRD